MSPQTLLHTHHPYFTPIQILQLTEKQRGKMSESQEEKARQVACGFIEMVGGRIGFPRATIASAQTLYHRFHLFFPWKDFNYHDVALASLYASTKMHDTLKKPRDILMVSYAVRFPELAAKSKNAGGEVDMDPTTVENDRQRLIAVETLMLKTISFNFKVRLPFNYVIKMSREFRATKELTHLAWRLAIDSHRTLAPLQYPPHVIALASIYLASLLSSFETSPSPPSALDVDEGFRNANEIARILGEDGGWERRYHARVDDLEEICHTLLDLLLAMTPHTTPNPYTSPSTPTSPSPHPSPSYPHTISSASSAPQNANSMYSTAHLTKLKIALREKEHPRRNRNSGGGDDIDGRMVENWSVDGLVGKHEGTVRFLFGPGFQS